MYIYILMYWLFEKDWKGLLCQASRNEKTSHQLLMLSRLRLRINAAPMQNENQRCIKLHSRTSLHFCIGQALSTFQLQEAVAAAPGVVLQLGPFGVCKICLRHLVPLGQSTEWVKVHQGAHLLLCDKKWSPLSRSLKNLWTPLCLCQFDARNVKHDPLWLSKTAQKPGKPQGVEPSQRGPNGPKSAGASLDDLKKKTSNPIQSVIFFVFFIQF